MKKVLLALSLVFCLSLVAGSLPAGAAAEEFEPDVNMTLHQSGNLLINGYGQAVRLLGTNVPHYGWTLAGPSMDEGDAMVDLALEEWQSNVVRLAVKPSYWNNGVYKLNNGQLVLENGEPVQLLSAEGFRQRVDAIVEKVARAGKYLLLDNHSFYLPGEDSVEFWKTAGERYKNHPNVIFGLFNEPTQCSWEQWKNGGRVQFQGQNDWGAEDNVDITSKGMQHLLDTLRSTGAMNVVTISGLDWGYDLTYVTTDYRLEDHPDANGIIYETHIYPERNPDYDTCFGIAAQEYPVLVGECGPQFSGQFMENLKDPSAQAYMDKLVEYLDKYELHLTAWSLGSAPNLLGSGNNPTEYGKIMKEYIQENQENLSVGLYDRANYQGTGISLNPGTYTAQQLEDAGFRLGALASISVKSNAYQYSITFFENADGSGRTYTIVNGTKNIKNYALGFEPVMIVIDRGMPVNLLEGSEKVHITAQNADSANLANLIDGTPAKWESTREGEQTLIFDIGEPLMLTGISVMHAGAAGELDVFNTAEFTISLSDNGVIYTRVADVKNNSMSQTDHYFDPIVATHIKIVIKAGGLLDPARACLSEVAAYGLPYTGDLSELPAQIGYDPGTQPSTPISRPTNVVIPTTPDTQPARTQETTAGETVSTVQETTGTTAQQTAAAVAPTTAAKRYVTKVVVNWPLVITGIVVGVLVVGGGITALVLLRKKRAGAGRDSGRQP